LRIDSFTFNLLPFWTKGKNMQIIGLVGEKGSGKDTFSKYLTEISDKKIAHIRFSDLLKETLKLWDIELTRANLQKLAQLLEDFGPGTIAHGLEKQIQKTEAEIIILDGIRWKPDIELLKKFPNHKLVYITANPKFRFERLKSRGEKVGESEMSYEQFLKEETAPNEVLIAEIGADADLKIVNNGSIEEFDQEIKNFCASFLSR
jgi:dephospho-CoA kinase